MSPDTQNYAVQWVQRGQSFNTYNMQQVTERDVALPVGDFACGGHTYTFRVFVMRADWVLSQGHQTQNVTPHSELFDVTTTHACPVASTGGGTTTTTTTIAATCATGGTCAVGDTGPGGGIVFYVHSDADNMFTSTESDCNTTCRYLEAATADQSAGIVWATTALSCYANASNDGNTNCQSNSIYSDTAGQAASRTAATAIGRGMANTNQIYARLTTAGGAATSAYAAGIAWAYSNGGKTDWHLPSKDELNELCKYARQQTTGDTSVACTNSGSLQTGFAGSGYWSSSELDATDAWALGFGNGLQNNGTKTFFRRVRPVRAF